MHLLSVTSIVENYATYWVDMKVDTAYKYLRMKYMCFWQSK